MDFIKQIEKDLNKAGIMCGSAEPPKYWHSLGNYVLNYIISGQFDRGIPQGRITALAGASGTGKSFSLCNIMREAQQDGAFIVVLDSENALDDEFVQKIGVDTSPDKYMYISVTTIPECKQIISKFTEQYKKEYGLQNDEAPKMLIAIDSLDMLMTETEVEHYSKGKSTGDQGQRSKQLKQMLREFVQAIKHHNISMVVTHQAYLNQDIRNGEGTWVLSNAVKYSLSQIVLLTKLKLRESTSTDVLGIRMKCEGYKTRFTQPYQSVTIEVPYEQGMDPYNGLMDVAIEKGIIKRSGGWYSLTDDPTKKFRGADFATKYGEYTLQKLKEMDNIFLDTKVDADEMDLSEATITAKSKREQKGLELND